MLKHADIKPVVNQSGSSVSGMVHNLSKAACLSFAFPLFQPVLYHPYVSASTQPLIDFQDDHDILFEGYSGLIPLTGRQGGPVDKPVDEIAKRLGLQPEQVLLAWSRAKG